MLRSLFSIVFLAFLLASCKTDNVSTKLFDLLDSEETGITFNNEILESDSLNILTYEYIYNGGGVAVFDFDNDGLMDLFFTGNMVPNKFYKNLGNLKFEDITDETGTGAPNYWCSGVAIIDINNDGYKDLYISTNTKKNAEERQNLLFINNLHQEGNMSFSEEAADYGINDTSFTTNSAFFDYDNDGDLDLFLLTNKIQELGTPGTYKRKKNDKRSGRVDKLFRNDFDQSKGHADFTDVSDEAGIVYEGFGLGLNIADINRDGWKDIYISNDFITVDLLYINNQDGTFTNKVGDYLKHIALAAMGNEIEDLNNDGQVEIVTVDMQPEYNYRRKTMMFANNYTSYLNNEKLGYIYQYSRNMLQLNNGAADILGNLPFSEIGMYSGIQATDWSWTPLISDFDLDGIKDIIITNGFPKDITDKDFIDYQADNMAFVGKSDLFPLIPEVKLHNYGYKGMGSLKFHNSTNDWGLDLPSFSNGAAYADLDQDGDLDLIINAINDEALIYRNNSSVSDANTVKLKIKGGAQNKDGLGTIVEYKSENITGIYEHSPYRGYLSSLFDEKLISFGEDSVFSVKVSWPDGSFSTLNNLPTNQTLELDQTTIAKSTIPSNDEARKMYFDAIALADEDISTKDLDYIDTNKEPLLLRKLSQLGPGISVADVNDDGYEDFYLTGSASFSGRLFLQDKNGAFSESKLTGIEKNKEEQGALFFDADNDGDQDLYISCGSNQFENGDSLYRDVLLINENGSFENSKMAKLPIPNISSSAVKASDFDHDGDLDLIVLGRSTPANYPVSASSFLLENNSQPGEINFTLANSKSANVLNDIGLVSDAIWSDYNNDGWQDLILAAEWSPPIFLKNDQGSFVKETNTTGLENESGWWNSVNSADFDGDGDMDYVLGNFGLNSGFNVSKNYPIRLYFKDIDNNGSLDIFPSTYSKDSLGVLNEFSYYTRGDLAKEISSIKAKFGTYAGHATSAFQDMFTEEEREGMQIVEAKQFHNVILENLGNGDFKVIELPWEAQLSSVFGSQIDDYDGDGNLDLLLIGNDHGVELTTGKVDAFNGLLLLGDGKLGFSPVSSSSSGFHVPGDGKALASIFRGGKQGVLASENNGKLSYFEKKINGRAGRFFSPGKFDLSILVYDSEDKLIRKHEFNYGSAYLSQSSRNVILPVTAAYVVIYSSDGKSRKETL